MDPDVAELLTAALIAITRLQGRLKRYAPARRPFCRCADCLAELDGEMVSINLRRKLSECGVTTAPAEPRERSSGGSVECGDPS
jgi:hypothetical protein